MNIQSANIQSAILKITLCLSILFFISGSAFAIKAKKLPLGDLVVYSGAECAQLNSKWVAGKIQSNGGFLSYPQLIKQLNVKIKKTSNTAQKNKLKKQAAGLKKKNEQDLLICGQFDIDVTAPKSVREPLPEAVTIAWDDDAGDEDLYLLNHAYSFYCPANGSQSSIWGWYTYSADSSICYSAAHLGLISLKFGGNVKIKITEGRDFYYSSLRNSITTSSYLEWHKSFVFLHPDSGEIIESSAPIIVPWTVGIGNLREATQNTFTYLCPAQGSKGSLWGTDTYTDDSSACTAGVHTGKINFKRGGLITVTKAPGQSSYTSSTRNGVESSSYGTWGGSFVVS